MAGSRELSKDQTTTPKPPRKFNTSTIRSTPKLQPHGSVSKACCTTASSSKVPTTTPTPLGSFESLPAEVRIQIYHALFDITKLSTTSSTRINYTEDELDHGHHIRCTSRWNEKDNTPPTLRVRSNVLTDELEFEGLPVRKPIGLLQTSGLIRREAMYELYGRVGLAVRKWNCVMKDNGIAHDHVLIRTWNLYRDLAVRDFLSNARVSIDIREGLGWAYVMGFQDNREAARRFPLAVRYLCRRVRCIELCVWFTAEDTAENQKRCLKSLADALGEESTVRYIRLRNVEETCPRGYCGEEKRLWQLRHEERLRNWKCAVLEMSKDTKKFPVTPARQVLWKRIFDESFPDISAGARQLCNVGEILDTRVVRRQWETHVNGVTYYHGRPQNRTRVEYLVRWKGYMWPVWEDPSYLLPKWMYEVICFHDRNPGKAKPADFAQLMLQVDYVADMLGVCVPGRASVVSEEVEDDGDVEDDEAFARAMGKVSMRGEVPSYKYVKNTLVASVG